ncbi:MAG: peptidoglycan editing factor PgeF [Gammaproteobacteria bacterium]|nr:MAG: peptidoglycan editing factor PgeF [Gammaproteobacteria bacterium]RLA00496.1 MAG: peptidoglycan editing factor PgeF [Gammaproteobacteria bacterium]
MDTLIYPDWPAPDNIKAISTTRIGGLSLPPYDGLNLAHHVGDNPDTVNKNRVYLNELADLPESPRWLNQIHETRVLDSHDWKLNIQADAMISNSLNHICAVMTADCLPVLLCTKQGDTVAAIHAGWCGLAAGIIEKTIHKFSCTPQNIMVWLGPAIGASQFEVGTDVYQLFTQNTPEAEQAFTHNYPMAKQAFQQTGSPHYLANIYLLAKQHLNKLGITAIYGGDYCTVTDKKRFFSYRRDGITGRMASMIWIADK